MLSQNTELSKDFWELELDNLSNWKYYFVADNLDYLNKKRLKTKRVNLSGEQRHLMAPNFSSYFFFITLYWCTFCSASVCVSATFIFISMMCLM